MKMADSLKLLLALVVLRLDGGLSFKSSHVGCVRRETPSLSPLRVASSTWATSNDGLGAHNITMNALFIAICSQYSHRHIASSARRTSIVDNSKYDRMQQKSKAPLVDSTLLRFLSAQKNGSLAPPNGSSEQFSTDASLATISEEAAIVEVEVPTPEQEFAIAAEIDQITHPTVGIDIQSEKMFQSQSWLSQYNAQKVALRLQALGVDESTALNTGRAVQDYVLARITRRRIRKFLQERDASWEAGKPLPFDRSGMKENISPAATINYSLDGIVTVMTEYGLTGNDIAAVLAHTPSVSMMKPRPNAIESENEGVHAGRRGFTLAEALDSAFVGLLGDTLKLRRYDARKVSIDIVGFHLRLFTSVYTVLV